MDKTEVVDSDNVRPITLVVISGGLWGASWSVEFMRRRLQEAGGQSTLVHVATSNTILKSYSGIDVCGSRLATEVRNLLKNRPELANVRKISFVGHSAGGLFARYAVGILHEEGFFEEKGVALDKVITAATPHLGVRSSPRGMMGRMKNGMLCAVGNIYGGPSLDQMGLIDEGPGGLPLLLHMSLPGTRYSKALIAAQGVYFYANARNDNTVSYCSSGVARRNYYRERKDVSYLEGFRYIAGISRVCDDADLRGEQAPLIDSGADTVEQSSDGATRSSEGIAEPPERGDEREPSPGLIGAGDSTTPRPATEPPDAPSGTDAQEASTEGETKIVNGGLGALAVIAAIAPLMFVHFISCIIPMRVAHTVLVEKTDVGKSDRDFYARALAGPAQPDAQTSSTSGKQEGDAPEGNASQGDASEGARAGNTDGVPLLPVDDAEPDGANAPLVPTADRRSPGAVGPSTDERISQSGAGGVGKDGDIVPVKRMLDEGVASVPALIRRNLARPELAIRRVDVCLPGIHTHGSIIVRQSAITRSGEVVIDHMATLLFQ